MPACRPVPASRGRRIWNGRQRCRRQTGTVWKGVTHVKLFAEMFTIAPGNKDHHVAIRCAVGVFVPLIILVLIDRMDLAIFASFGAFTGIYGRGEMHRKRLFIQVRAGSLMLLVILLATLSLQGGAGAGPVRRREHLDPGGGHHLGGRSVFAGDRLVAAPAGRFAVPYLRLRGHRLDSAPAAVMAVHARFGRHNGVLPADRNFLPRGSEPAHAVGHAGAGPADAR